MFMAYAPASRSISPGARKTAASSTRARASATWCCRAGQSSIRGPMRCRGRRPRCRRCFIRESTSRARPLEAVIDIDGQATRVFSIHLSHLAGGQRGAQIGALHGLVAALPKRQRFGRPTPQPTPGPDGQPAPAVPGSSLLFGDFNIHPGDPDYQLIEKHRRAVRFLARERAARERRQDRCRGRAAGSPAWTIFSQRRPTGPHPLRRGSIRQPRPQTIFRCTSRSRF